MKSCLIEVSYNTYLLLPGECAQFLPQAEIVESTGYGLDRETRRTGKAVEVKFIDAEDVLSVRPPVDPPAAAPEPEAVPLERGAVVESEMPF